MKSAKLFFKLEDGLIKGDVLKVNWPYPFAPTTSDVLMTIYSSVFGTLITEDIAIRNSNNN